MCFDFYAPLPHDIKRRMWCKEKDIKIDRFDGEWTEYVSNSRGRIFFYNKKLDVKQLKTPKGIVMR